MFLTMMGEHLYDFDADSELLAAFECFDEGDTGFVKCDEIRKWLGDVGERMDEHEVSFLFIAVERPRWVVSCDGNADRSLARLISS